MMKTTQKELKSMIATGRAVDITTANNSDRGNILAKEGSLYQIAYSAGVYGCNGQLYQGKNTGVLYAIAARSTAIYLFS